MPPPPPPSRITVFSQACGFFRDAGGQRVDVGRFVERGHGARGAIHQVDQIGKGVTEKAGNAQGNVDARTAQHARRHDLETGDPPASGFPLRLHAHQRQGLRDIVAAGAHVGGAPA
jgi:hypothetical protein